MYVAAMATIMMMSCSHDEYKFDPARWEAMQKEAFTENFLKKFGPIASDQSWDFGGSPMTGLASRGTRSTRGTTPLSCTPDLEYPYLDADGYYEVPTNMQKAMTNLIKENINNKTLGNVYAMSLPDNNFTIIPLRQGYTSSTYEVHMVVGEGADAVDYTLWKKGEMMQRRVAGSTKAWADLQDKEGSFSYGNYDIRSRVITFRNMPANAPMYFYLSRPTRGEYPASLEGYLMDFSDIIPLPEQLMADGKHVKVMGIEGAYTETDFDYEDVMFMIVGDPTLPEDIVNIGDMAFEQTVEKRYMIEDLGETDDTDYNDIVVDVKSSRTISFEYNPQNGKITNRTYGEWKNQTATIRHLGGVLAFNLTIGNTSLGWMTGQMNADPNTVHDVSGWNPDTNNITVNVRQAQNQEAVNSITFPAVGSVPLIIATNINTPWMDERVSILPKLKELIINKAEDK